MREVIYKCNHCDHRFGLETHIRIENMKAYEDKYVLKVKEIHGVWTETTIHLPDITHFCDTKCLSKYLEEKMK